MRVKVLHNTHIKLKYNKIHNLINKVISIVIIRPVIIVTIWNANTYIHTCDSLIKCKICIIIVIITVIYKIIH
jgi:hypothetical protein